MKHERITWSIMIMSVLFSLKGNAQYAWKELGNDITPLDPNTWFLSTTTDPAGNVYAAGLYYNANGYKYVAKYDGTS